MSLKCGMIGLPNVGKSTLFSALTKIQVPSENYPFCTIDPHKAIVKVPDSRLTEIARVFKPSKAIPASMEFVDIAGLVKGAHRGEGLGNQFLSHIRESHALIHILRCFEDPKITHVNGKVDPLNDMDVVNTELILSDLQSIESYLKKQKKLFLKKTSSEMKAAKAEEKLLLALEKHLSEGFSARSFFMKNRSADKNEDKSKNKEKLFELRELHLLSLKPVLYICNVGEKSVGNFQNSEDSSNENSLIRRVRKKVEKEGHKILSLCGSLELELSQLEEDEERREFLNDLGFKEPSLDRLIRLSYQLLGLETFFTAGPKEVRAWTMRKETKAPQAGGLIHSDFEKGFIRAEVYSFEDFFRYKEEKLIRAAGLYRSEGKDYTLKDGDIVLFRFNVKSH